MKLSLCTIQKIHEHALIGLETNYLKRTERKTEEHDKLGI